MHTRTLSAVALLACLAGTALAQTKTFRSNFTFSRGDTTSNPFSRSWQTPMNVSWDADTWDVTTPAYTPVSGFFAAGGGAGRCGLDLTAGITGGQFSASIPTTISYTAPTTIRPGERVTLSSSKTINDGFRFDTTALKFNASLDFVFKAHYSFGAGVDPPFVSPWTTGQDETSIPNNAPQAMLDRHRDDVTILSTRGLPNGEYRQPLLSFGSGATTINQAIPGTRGILSIIGSPLNLPGEIHGGTRAGDVISGENRSSGPVIGASVSLSNLWNVLAPLAGLPPVGFTFPDPDAKFNVSANLIEGRINGGVYMKAGTDFDMSANDAIKVTYYDQNRAVLGSAPLGAPFSFTAPDNLDGFKVTAEASINNARLTERLGLSMAADFQLNMINGSLNAYGLDVFSFGPFLSRTVNIAESPTLWLPSSTSNIAGTNPARWGVASQDITFQIVPAPGALALVAGGLLAVTRRRR